ncbi:MAG: hypothetical protein ABIK93_00905 [candidate division WOR-3 bacterium]
MIKKLFVPIATFSVAFETNGKGFLGFIVELPGAFIRGKTEAEALAKVNQEVKSYLKWLKIKQDFTYKTNVVQYHQSQLMVEDADSAILLNADKGEMEEEEFVNLSELVRYSGKTILKIYHSAELKDWVDGARIRKTFYGDNFTTIEGIFGHIKRCQYYYLSRTKIPFEPKEEDFMKIREFCLTKIKELYQKENNFLIFNTDNELWTLKKILRRFIWHDRIHGKAIIRILAKQKELGLIDRYEDPFYFTQPQ